MVLSPARARQFKKTLLVNDKTHTCHKTDRPGMPQGKVQHCAGAMIVLEKLERPNQLMRVAERLRIYNRLNLDMDAPVYDSFEQMIERSDNAYPSRLDGRKEPRDR